MNKKIDLSINEKLLPKPHVYVLEFLKFLILLKTKSGTKLLAKLIKTVPKNEFVSFFKFKESNNKFKDMDKELLNKYLYMIALTTECSVEDARKIIIDFNAWVKTQKDLNKIKNHARSVMHDSGIFTLMEDFPYECILLFL